MTAEQDGNLPPSKSMKNFGRIDIEGATGMMKVSRLDVGDKVLWSILTPDAA